MINKIVRSIFPEFVVDKFREKWQNKRLISEWQKNGCKTPPPHIVKQLTIIEYQETYKYNILVETGTYLGDMVAAQKSRFSNIYSIELGVDLYKKAKARFKNDKNVIILHGDSGMFPYF